nr:hypothetical protein [Candidatus Acidoferrales bacterium]
MRRYSLAVLCFTFLLADVAAAQKFVIEPVKVASGTILAFHMQTRLHPNSEDLLDVLPSGTVLQVRIE